MKVAQKLGLLLIAMCGLWWLAVSRPERTATTDGGPSSEPEAADTAIAPDPTQPAGWAAPPAAPRQREKTANSPSASTEPAPINTPEPEATRSDSPTQVAQVAAPQKQGPVEELAQRFAGESRDSSSPSADERVKSAFDDPAIPDDTLRTVECRRSVCRAELRWSPERDAAYVLGLTRAVGSFEAPLGINEAGPADADGLRPLVVYFGLKR